MSAAPRNDRGAPLLEIKRKVCQRNQPAVKPNPEHWRPSADLDVLRLRARLLRQVRAFFDARDVLEVDTPLLSRYTVTAPHLASWRAKPEASTSVESTSTNWYLQTSPEYAMKRLLAAGSGDIFQITHAFRAGESGRLHNPEFTLIEWYRSAMVYQDLMREVAQLVHMVLADTGLQAEPLLLSYRDAFLRYVDIDPLSISDAELPHAAHARKIQFAGELDRDSWLDLLMTHVVEPSMPRDQMVFIYDFPVSQAALAQLRQDTPPVAERFELFVNGVELANGYQELTDAEEQRRRFATDAAIRQQHGLASVDVDEYLLAALHHGLPPAAGVALGFDRLVMLAAGVDELAQIMAFPVDRC